MQVLQFVFQSDQLQTLLLDWDVKKIADCTGARRYDRPRIYVVSNQSMVTLRSFPDFINDRGMKDPRKGLNYYLLGLNSGKIPMIDGQYENERQVVRSLRTLLEKAVQLKAHRLFVVGIPERVFSVLVKKTGAGAAAAEPVQDAPRLRMGTKTLEQSMQEMSIENILAILQTKNNTYDDILSSLVGESLPIRLIRQLIAHAAQGDFPVMILGPSGSGKENVAKEIHARSRRGNQPFVAVNCSAIPEKLFESEVFGCKKGSHSEAYADREGLWVSASGGTLFLDEIGDLCLEHQAKILRALQENEIRPVGSVKCTKVDARIISATNRDLIAMMQNGSFRDDLYYRLCCFPIRTPALKSLRRDISPIARSLWREVTNNPQATLPQEVIDELQKYHWPGNVRELKMLLNRLHALFYEDEPGVTQVRVVFALQQQLKKDYRMPDEKDQTIFHLAEKLDHLKSVSATLHAIKAQFLTLEDSSLSGTPLPVEPLKIQLTELEMLCREPASFGDQGTFFAVHQFHGKLMYFADAMTSNPDDAEAIWKNNIQADLESTLRRLTETANELKSAAGMDSSAQAARKID